MNPIKSINGIKNLKTPSSYKLGWQDISNPKAGRTMDGTMHKKTVATKLKIELSWNVASFEEGQQILQATSSEYFTCEYLGINGVFETKTFYRGDVSADFYGEPANVWRPIKFNLIER